MTVLSKEDLKYRVQFSIDEFACHRHHMAILQPSALASDILHLGFVHIYAHASIHHVILPLIKPFN